MRLDLGYMTSYFSYFKRSCDRAEQRPTRSAGDSARPAGPAEEKRRRRKIARAGAVFVTPIPDLASSP